MIIVKRSFYNALVILIMVFFSVDTKSWASFWSPTPCGDALSDISIFAGSRYGGELDLSGQNGFLAGVRRWFNRFRYNRDQEPSYRASDQETLRRKIFFLSTHGINQPLDLIAALVRSGRLPRQGVFVFRVSDYDKTNFIYSYVDEVGAERPTSAIRNDEDYFYAQTSQNPIVSGRLFIGLSYMHENLIKRRDSFFSYTRPVQRNLDHFLIEGLRAIGGTLVTAANAVHLDYKYDAFTSSSEVLIGTTSRIDWILSDPGAAMSADLAEGFGSSPSTTMFMLLGGHGHSLCVTPEEIRAFRLRDPLFSFSDRGDQGDFLVRAFQDQGVWKIREIKISEISMPHGRPVTLEAVIPPLILEDGSRPGGQEVLSVKTAFNGDAFLVARRYEASPGGHKKDVIEMYRRNAFIHQRSPEKVWNLLETPFRGMDVSPQGDRLVVVSDSPGEQGTELIALNLRHNSHLGLNSGRLVSYNNLFRWSFDYFGLRSYDPMRTPHLSALRAGVFGSYSIKTLNVLFSEDGNRYQIEARVRENGVDKILRSPVRVIPSLLTLVR